jgi:hypothetical protein
VAPHEDASPWVHGGLPGLFFSFSAFQLFSFSAFQLFSFSAFQYAFLNSAPG